MTDLTSRLKKTKHRNGQLSLGGVTEKIGEKIDVSVT